MKYLFLCILFLSTSVCYSQVFIELNSGVTTQLNSSSSCRPLYWSYEGWACGVNGVIIKGNLTGQWTNLTGNGVPTSINLTNIFAIDTGTAWVCGSTAANTWIWKTTNSGFNWFQVFNQPTGSINAIVMRNSLVGFTEGNPVTGRWSLWKTTDGGLNWDSTGLYLPQSGNETGWPNSLCLPIGYYFSPSDTNNIWFGTNNYRIYHSSDFGQTWSVQSTQPEQNSFSIEYSYNGQVFAGGSTFALKSTNYGSNWTTMTLGGSGKILTGGSDFLRGNEIYQNSGNHIYTAPAGIYTYANYNGNGNWYEFYAVRTNGGITSFAWGEGIKKIGNEVPKEFLLSQNYPNPFNPNTKFKIQIAKFSDVKVIIFDVLGREVATIVNEPLKPGTYEVEWDGSNHTSGIYFYKLTTEDFSQTKKMVLVK